MADTVKINLCILWEGELRTAARLLRAWHDLPDDAPEAPQALAEAINASIAALWDLTDERAAVLVGSDEIRKRVAKARTANTKDAPHG